MSGPQAQMGVGDRARLPEGAVEGDSLRQVVTPKRQLHSFTTAVQGRTLQKDIP